MNRCKITTEKKYYCFIIKKQCANTNYRYIKTFIQTPKFKQSHRSDWISLVNQISSFLFFIYRSFDWFNIERWICEILSTADKSMYARIISLKIIFEISWKSIVKMLLVLIQYKFQCALECSMIIVLAYIFRRRSNQKNEPDSKLIMDFRILWLFFVLATLQHIINKPRRRSIT